MKKCLNVVIIVVLMCMSTFTISAEDLLPSEEYYRDNIAVNDVAAKAPTLKTDESLTGPGGEGTGDGPWVGAQEAPLEDAVIPVLVVALSYAVFLLYRKKMKKAF